MKEYLLHWAATNQVYVIEDDYDGEFQYRDRPVPSLQGADQYGVVIYMGTFSKAFTPALRMNYMVLPEQLLIKLHSMEHVLSCPSRMDQLAMSVFMERGHWYRHIRRTRKRYRAKRDYLVKLIEEHLSPFTQAKVDSVGLHIEIKVRAKHSRSKLIELAYQEGVLLYGPQYEGQYQEGEQSKIYLGFGGVSDDEMEKGILLMKKAWAEE